MTKAINHLEQCKRLIEEKLGWGDSTLWRTQDFERLSVQILEQTGVSLSTSTLRRLWGHNRYDGKPNLTTLDALAVFAGHSDWRSFERFMNEKEDVDMESDSAHVSSNFMPKKWTVGLLLVVLLAILSMVFLINFMPEKDNVLDESQFTLETKHMAGGIPNSVIFTYRVPKSIEDSVYIQQSWDPTKRVQVDPRDSTHTSMYYVPGVHHAKLIIGQKVVKQETLIIATEGWTALIEHEPNPIYLDTASFKKERHLAVDPATISDLGVELRVSPKLVQFHNVGNFEAQPMESFQFGAELRSGFNEGASACQYTYVMLYTDRTHPIIIPLSQRGCISELNLATPDTLISGKNHDLSGFGTDINQWTQVTCEARNGMLAFGVNGATAYEIPMREKAIRILGIGFFFRGTGAVRNVLLKSESNEVYHDLF